MRVRVSALLLLLLLSEAAAAEEAQKRARGAALIVPVGAPLRSTAAEARISALLLLLRSKISRSANWHY